MPRPPAVDRAASLAPLLKALGDERRLALVLLLAERAHTVTELQDATRLSQPLVSHHLKTLREHGLVSVTAQGRSNRYSLCCDALGDPLRALGELVAGARQAA